MKKSTMFTVKFLAIAMALFLVLNYFEIMIKHDGPNPEYSEWNFIAKCITYADEVYGQR